MGKQYVMGLRAAAWLRRVSLGGLVARVTQPYRVRGARAPGSPVRQDAAWAEVVAALRKLTPAVPLIQGGRGDGARVACGPQARSVPAP